MYIIDEANITLVLTALIDRNIPWDINVTFEYHGLSATGKL